MERLLLYLDDIDDLIGAVGLLAERIRSLLLAAAAIVVALTALISAIVLTLVYPPVALPTCALLVLTLIHQAAAESAESGTRTI